MSEGGGRFVSPRAGWAGALQNRLGNAPRWARLRRATLARLPFPKLRSDVRDVVYATWVVPADAVQAWVPPGVGLTARNGQVLLTVLSYRHGRFGPVLAGPLRRLFPSPLQSNWRCYVATLHDRPPAAPTVLFLANVFDSALYALGTRLFSDVLPSHLSGRFVLRNDEHGCMVEIGGGGSAPSLRLETLRAAPALPFMLASFFTGWREAVAMLARQDAAVAAVPEDDALALARIELPIALDDVVPLTVSKYRPGTLLRQLGAVKPPFCFLVPRVTFRVLSERLVGASARL